MTVKLKTDTGGEVEAMTEEEIETHVKEQVAAKEKELTDKFEQDKKVLEEKLAKAGEKDYNFANLRDSKEAVEKKLKEITDKYDKDISGVKELITSEHKNKLVRSLAGNDEELKKLIEHHYGRITGDATTHEQIEQKMREAFILATGGKSTDILAKIIPSSSSPVKPTSGQASAEAVELGAKFGLKEDDFKKYKK